MSKAVWGSLVLVHPGTINGRGSVGRTFYYESTECPPIIDIRRPIGNM